MNKTKDNSEIVYETIKKEIIDATRKPGDIFNEKEFAANMGISRTPVREAVLRLSNEGLLVVMPRRGTFVSHISMADVRDMYQVRKILEPQIAYIAAQKCDKDIGETFLKRKKPQESPIQRTIYTQETKPLMCIRTLMLFFTFLLQNVQATNFL